MLLIRIAELRASASPYPNVQFASSAIRQLQSTLPRAAHFPSAVTLLPKMQAIFSRVCHLNVRASLLRSQRTRQAILLHIYFKGNSLRNFKGAVFTISWLVIYIHVARLIFLLFPSQLSHFLHHDVIYLFVIPRFVSLFAPLLGPFPT